ncbi:MAG: hypothetical protein FJW64_16340 [Actinobacteria bacterium]|nr:hypothetical protein [Actinomycetota bacterium]
MIVSIDVAVHHASRREKFATGSDEWSIVTALEYLFEHLTVRDEQQLLLILAPHLFATYEDDPPREIRLPVDGSIGFEIAAVARRVRRVWNPLDGGCSPPEPGAG